MIKELSDDQLELLLTDHWREIKGILKEMKYRRDLPKSDKEPLGFGHRDRRTPG